MRQKARKVKNNEPNNCFQLSNNYFYEFFSLLQKKRKKLILEHHLEKRIKTENKINRKSEGTGGEREKVKKHYATSPPPQKNKKFSPSNCRIHINFNCAKNEK